MDFLSLPEVVLEQIFSLLSYDDIAKCRSVCSNFNIMSQYHLNRGFSNIEKRHATQLKAVKNQLPRRESERRHHPMARHCDILTSIETRISMLNMTYAKYIDHNMCCFIPGKVIDEMSRVLDIVSSSKIPPRAHEVLQELRDISSMAIEHFDEKVCPPFRKALENRSSIPTRRRITLDNDNIRETGLKKCCVHSRLGIELAKKLSKRVRFYERLVARQSRLMKEMSSKQDDHAAAINELKKRIQECESKHNIDVVASPNHNDDVSGDQPAPKRVRLETSRPDRDTMRARRKPHRRIKDANNHSRCAKTILEKYEK